MSEIVQLKKVEPIREAHSRYDMVIKGRTIRFTIAPQKEGVEAKFVLERKLKEIVPPFLQGLIGSGPEDDTIHYETLMSECFKLQWWEKLLGIKLEKKVSKWANARKKELEEFLKNESEAERIRRTLG